MPGVDISFNISLMALPVMPSNRFANVNSDTFMVSSFIFIKKRLPLFGEGGISHGTTSIWHTLAENALKGKLCFRSFPKRCIRRTGLAYAAFAFGLELREVFP
jgi:hypothetical protein